MNILQSLSRPDHPVSSSSGPIPRYPLQSTLLLGLLCLLGGCVDDTSDLEKFVADTKQNQHGIVEPLPEFEPYRSFVYNADLLRDPFIPQTEIEVEQGGNNNGLHPEANRRKEPLEYFPLDTLKMVGILAQDNIDWGLVQAPDGTIHKVLTGNYIGENDGKILQISEEKITIKEIISDGLGGYLERDAALAMSDE